jgi:hypothetical protein
LALNWISEDAYLSKWIGFTNQKLYQVRLLLEQRERLDGPEALLDGLEQGAQYLLYDAYVSYLNELAEMANYRQPVATLEDLLAHTPLVTGEMKEIQFLRADSFSWLTAMLKAVAEQAQPTSSRTIEVDTFDPFGDAASLNSITLLQDNASPASKWLSQLSDLIDAQRENRQES